MLEEDAGPPLFTLHSISATSPVRKKVDITIHESSIRFTHPSTHAVEATVTLSSLHRAFIVPTRGKSRAYWTVILLSSDIASALPQIIFGMDAQTLTPASATTYGSAMQPATQTFAKGSATLPLLRDFLSHLPAQALPVLEPSTAVFRSACVGACVGAGTRPRKPSREAEHGSLKRSCAGGPSGTRSLIQLSQRKRRDSERKTSSWEASLSAARRVIIMSCGGHSARRSTREALLLGCY